jgi:hypothetical protein
MSTAIKQALRFPLKIEEEFTIFLRDSFPDAGKDSEQILWMRRAFFSGCLIGSLGGDSRRAVFARELREFFDRAKGSL